MKKQSEIRLSPIRDPVRINVILPHNDLKMLKSHALECDTTVNEIIRTLVSDYTQTETVADDGGAMGMTMTLREAYAVLVYHNQWRRDDHDPDDPDALPQPDPVQVGEAIDLAIETIRPIAWPHKAGPRRLKLPDGKG